MAKTLTLALMDPPYETETTTTAFRILDAALPVDYYRGRWKEPKAETGSVASARS